MEGYPGHSDLGMQVIFALPYIPIRRNRIITCPKLHEWKHKVSARADISDMLKISISSDFGVRAILGSPSHRTKYTYVSSTEIYY